MDRRAVNDLLRLHERNRFLPGLRTWVGYAPVNVMYDREERAARRAKTDLSRASFAMPSTRSLVLALSRFVPSGRLGSSSVLFPFSMRSF